MQFMRQTDILDEVWPVPGAIAGPCNAVGKVVPGLVTSVIKSRAKSFSPVPFGFDRAIFL